MKVTIRDDTEFARISPIAASAYLAAQGWQERTTPGEKWSMWTKNGEFEVGLPLTKTLRDYARRMAELVATLERVEERSQLEIAADLENSGFDVIRLRLATSDTNDGSLAIEQAVEMVSRSRDLLLSAACSAVTPKLYYPARKPAAASDYIKKVRLGQTERGSFVFTILSPVAPRLMTLFEEEVSAGDPFERRVTSMLVSAVQAVNEATLTAVATQKLEAFEAAVDRGVSANLCDALSGIGSGVSGTRNVDLTFSWALTRQTARSVDILRISNESIPVIEEAARIMKAKAPREEFELSGVVTKLHREDPQDKGQVTVLGLVDGEPRKVSLEVSGADYKVAIWAHDEYKPLRAYGVLVKDGKSYKLKNPRDLKFGDDEE